MQVLPVIVPYIKTTSNLALSCGALRGWLSNNGFSIKSSKGDLRLENLSFYKLLEYPDLDEWTLNECLGAINSSNCDHLLSLLQAGANIEAKGRNGDTALICAALQGETKCLKLLLQHKANIEAKCIYGETALAWAAYYSQTECLKILVESGAKVRSHVWNKYPQYAVLWGDSIL